MRTGSFIIKYRWWILAVAFLIAAVFGLQIFRAEINPDLETYIYEKLPSRVNTVLIEEIFGGDELIMVLFEAEEDILSERTLERLKKINHSMDELEGIDETLSLFDAKYIRGIPAGRAGGAGAMVVDPVIRRIPGTDGAREKLREEIRDNDLVYKVLVSRDFKLTCIIATLKPDVVDDVFIDRVEEIIAAHPGPEEVYIGGLPYIKAFVTREMAREFKVLLMIGLGIMLIMLYLFFREIRGVLLPFLVVVLSILFSMGLMPLLGWKMSIITLLLPIMLIAIANDYGIHLMAKYQEYNHADNGVSIHSISKGIFTSLRSPIILTGITTISGILCLLSHQMIPARQLGIVAAAGIAFALLLSLLLIPAALSVLGKSKPVYSVRKEKQGAVERLLEYTSRIIQRKPRTILVLAGLITLFSGAGVFLVHVDTNLENFFPDRHPVKVSAGIINETFGGSQNISILVEGDILDPKVMGMLDRFETRLKSHPAVGNVMSIAGVLREISQAMYDRSDPMYNRIPESRNAIAQYMELYMMSGDPEDLERMVDFDFRRAQVMIRINDGSSLALRSVLDEIEAMTRNSDLNTRIGGYGLIASDLAVLVVRGQIISLSIALLVVFLLMSLQFRSFTAGLIGTIPLALAMIILFGWMGYLGIELDVATALLSSIMIGVGVDYTIHFLWRYRQERNGGLQPAAAVSRTLCTTGRGISFNALSVVLGFCALPFSLFTPIQVFGYLVMVSILTCLIGALVIVPAIVMVFNPAFAGSAENPSRDRSIWRIDGLFSRRKPLPQN